MDRALQEYYESRFETMSSKGWEQIIEATLDIKNTISIESLNSNEQLWFAKGQLDILNWVLSLKEASERAYEDLSK